MALGSPTGPPNTTRTFGLPELFLRCAINEGKVDNCASSATEIPTTSNHSLATARNNSDSVEEISSTTSAPAFLKKSATMVSPKKCCDPGAQANMTRSLSSCSWVLAGDS